MDCSMDLREFLYVNNYEQAIFRQAIYKSDSGLVRLLIERNNNLKDQVLHVAAHLGNIEILKDYISTNDINAKGLEADNRFTPIQRAVSENQLHAVKFLVEKGANVNILCSDRCYGNCSVLNIAIHNHPNNLEMINFLLEQRADPNYSCDKCYTPLVKAINNYQEKIVDLLLKFGAKVNLECNYFGDKITPLYMAVKQNQLRTVKLLLSKSADVAAVTPVRKQSILHAGIPFAEQQVIECLLNAGVDVNIVNSSYQTAVELGGIKDYKFTSIIKEHLVKLKAADFHLSESNLKVINSLKLNELFTHCSIEIEEMKKCRIAHTRVTFYDLLHTNEQTVALRFKNVKEENILNYCKEFPLYSNLINYRLKRVLIRQEKLANVNAFFEDVLWSLLPDTFVRNISSYLSENYVERLNKYLLI